MVNRLRKLKVRGLLLAGLLLVSCTPRVTEQQPVEPIKLKVLLLPYFSFAPFFIAEEEGYFAEQMLEVEYIEMHGSADAIPALAQGDLDVLGGIIGTGLINAVAREANIRFVADKGFYPSSGCAPSALMARRTLAESGDLSGPAQLRGRRIALIPATSEEYLLEKLLKEAGLTLSDVEILNTPIPVLPEALEKGSVDVGYASEPWVTRIVQAGQGAIWVPVEQLLPGFQVALIAYGPSLLEDNPEAGERFMVSYLKAVRQYNEGKTERNLEILAEHTGLDRQLMVDMCWPPLRSDGEMNIPAILDFQAWAVEKGYIDVPVTEDQFWDPSFIDYANGVLGASTQ